jgi:hypothetical protein
VKGDLVYRVDSAIGEVVDNAVTSHHRRRLRKLGWEHALEASGDGWPPEIPHRGPAIRSRC